MRAGHVPNLEKSICVTSSDVRQRVEVRHSLVSLLRSRVVAIGERKSVNATSEGEGGAN